jgi:hypothetical protein
MSTKTSRFQVPNNDRALQRAENIASRPAIKLTVRLPDDVHRWLTMKARDDRSSIQEIMLAWAKKAMQRDAA